MKQHERPGDDGDPDERDWKSRRQHSSDARGRASDGAVPNNDLARTPRGSVSAAGQNNDGPPGLARERLERVAQGPPTNQVERPCRCIASIEVVFTTEDLRMPLFATSISVAVVTALRVPDPRLFQ